MADEEVQPISVNPGKYIITTKTNESPMIEQLEGCVGVGLIQKTQSITKRGLAHVFFGGTLRMFDDSAMKDANNLLNNFVSAFISTYPAERPDEKKPEPIRPIISYVPCIYNGSEWINPMATFVIDWLPRRGIMISKEDIDSAATYPAERGQQISHKQLVIHSTEAYSVYKDRAGRMLNHHDLKNFKL